MNKDKKANAPVSQPRAVDSGKKPQNGEALIGHAVHETVASFATRVGPSFHPIFDKFQSEHVTQFLGNIHQTNSTEQQIRKSNRWFHLVYTLIGVGIFVFLTWYLLPERSELYFEILKALGIFIAGGAGGYGLKTYHSERDKRG